MGFSADKNVKRQIAWLLRACTVDERFVDVRHDSVEDGPSWTFERLKKEGVAPPVRDALRHVSKRPGDQRDSEVVYAVFVRRAKGNKIARRVKTADIHDNLNALRLSALTEKEIRRGPVSGCNM